MNMPTLRLKNQPVKLGLVGFLVAAVVAIFLVSSAAIQPHEVAMFPSPGLSASRILDGMTFSGTVGSDATDADVLDELTFADGKFVSVECDRRCGYPPAPYFVRRTGNRIEFETESNCTRQDAKITWRGTIENGALKGRFTWISKRWYWTLEKEFWFEGTLVSSAPSSSSTIDYQ